MPAPRKPAPIGQRFGMLTVVGDALGGDGRTKWRAECDCGKVVSVQPSHLRAGSTISCGCAPRQGRLTHGQSRSRTYKSWIAMRERCENPNVAAYPRYGGAGIGVCDRWQKFENFLADMGERPIGSTIDRLDGKGNYEPSNCRWTTVDIQNRNRSNVRKIGGQTISDYASSIGMPYHKIWAAVRAGEIPCDA